MTAGICSVCDGRPGCHDMARHKAYDRNRSAWARPGTPAGQRAETGRLTRENTRLRAELADALRLCDAWRRVAMENTAARLRR